ncbi:ArgR family transcriptional regulator [Lachnotalea glycerini]|uniref:Arginine repressor n=1 Tax=Lachnotalea glycerini TaxID=1763509 RepID=A0A255I217_9FIRM|nr:arginine repressor [Lachnotalea glycerini]PXV93657.1 ArgR family transcriptional regulator [Lachnotalea glycerini]RDY32603.1 arginine repressor [Lachnotalea glycerini]
MIYIRNNDNIKEERQKIILELIKTNSVCTQEELRDLLIDKGYETTQATVSRDIRQLNLVKAVGPNGEYCYRRGKQSDQYYMSHKFYSIFMAAVKEVSYAGNLVVIKCESGMANPVCVILDSFEWRDILGTIAGNDTILIVAKDAESAGNMSKQFKNMM